MGKFRRRGKYHFYDSYKIVDGNVAGVVDIDEDQIVVRFERPAFGSLEGLIDPDDHDRTTIYDRLDTPGYVIPFTSVHSVSLKGRTAAWGFASYVWPWNIVSHISPATVTLHASGEVFVWKMERGAAALVREINSHPSTSQTPPLRLPVDRYEPPHGPVESS